MGGGDLRADAGLALGHDGVGKSNDVDAPFSSIASAKRLARAASPSMMGVIGCVPSRM